jgi:Putative auto-transporter adhesin, head GIN domain
MQTNSRALGIGLVLVALLPACLKTPAQDRGVRDLGAFESVAIGGGLDLLLRQGERFVVEVESSDGDSSDIITEVRAGTLEIRREHSFFDFFHWGDHGSVQVTMPKLVSLTASGGSDVTTEGTFPGDAVRINASGGSDVIIDVSANTLEAQASGGSDLSLTGSARSARLEASGGSDLNASRFTADEANLQSTGGSDLSVTVRDKIVANASGGSDITYGGEPSSVEINKSGGGDVTRR